MAGILLLEEINLVNAAVTMGALGQLVEFPFIIKKFGYQPLRRHPLCIIITTMNTGTAGSKSMSQPFANRFKQSFVLDDPKKDDFIRILMNTGASRDICRWVYDCYERVVACVEDTSLAIIEAKKVSDILGIGIGIHHCKELKKMYQGRFIDVQDINELTSAVCRQLKNILRKWL